MTCEVVVITWLSTDEVSWFGFWEKKAPMISWATKSGSQYEFTWIISGIREELLIRWSERYLLIEKVTQKTPPLIRIKPLQYILKLVKIKTIWNTKKTDFFWIAHPQGQQGSHTYQNKFDPISFQVKKVDFYNYVITIRNTFFEKCWFQLKNQNSGWVWGDISQMNRGTYIRNK